MTRVHGIFRTSITGGGAPFEPAPSDPPLFHLWALCLYLEQFVSIAILIPRINYLMPNWAIIISNRAWRIDNREENLRKIPENSQRRRAIIFCIRTGNPIRMYRGQVKGCALWRLRWGLRLLADRQRRYGAVTCR